jgi:hypothetical protein
MKDPRKMSTNELLEAKDALRLSNVPRNQATNAIDDRNAVLNELAHRNQPVPTEDEAEELIGDETLSSGPNEISVLPTDCPECDALITHVMGSSINDPGELRWWCPHCKLTLHWDDFVWLNIDPE